MSEAQFAKGKMRFSFYDENNYRLNKIVFILSVVLFNVFEDVMYF